MPRGNKQFTRTGRAWGMCMRSGLRYYRRDLVEDDYVPGLIVHPSEFDPIDPQEQAFAPVIDPMTIRKPSPDVSREDATIRFPMLNTATGVANGGLNGNSALGAPTVSASGSAILPSSIAALDVWFDGSQPGNLIADSSNNVTTWFDKSGNNRHATLPSGKTSPVYDDNSINGLGSVYSNGATNIMMDFTHSVTTADNYTCFVVIKGDTSIPDPTTGSVLNVALAFSDSTTAISALSFRQTGDATDPYTAHGTITGIAHGQGSTLGAGAYTNAKLYTLGYDGTNGYGWVHQTSDFTSAVVGPQTINGGRIFADFASNPSARSYVGWVAEIVIYKSFLDNTNRQTVWDYLTAKWNLS